MKTSLQNNKLFTYLYSNLTKCVLHQGHASKTLVSESTQIANTAIARRWRNHDKQVDDVSMFLAEKQDYINQLAEKGLTVESFALATQDPLVRELCKAFRNWMIDQWKHEQTGQMKFENSIVTMESEKLIAVTNKWETEMINEIENEKKDVDMERMVLDAISSFSNTLTDEDDVIALHYFACSRRDKAAANAAMSKMGVCRNTFFKRTAEIEAAFKAYCEAKMKENK